MATIYGTILGVTNVKRADSGGARNTARLALSFGTYTAASDTASVSAVTTAISNTLRNGKTITLRSAICSGAGSDAAQSVFTGAITVSGATMTFDLTNAAGTEVNVAAMVRPLTVDVAFDES